MIPQTLPRFGPAFAGLAPWRETLFWRSLVAARVPASHRKGAKDAKGDSQASETTVPFVSGHCDLQHGSAAI